jgi:predicted dienelactone hydrolase
MSNRFRCIGALFASLLAGAPVHAAEQIQFQIDGLKLPVDLRELEAWSRDPGRTNGDLDVWLSLIGPVDRRALARLLQAPLLKEPSFAVQLLRSRTGEPLIEALGSLLTTAQGESTAPLLRSTLRTLLQQQKQVRAFDLLRALPSEQLSFNLDAAVAFADRWRRQVDQQADALRELRALPLPLRRSIPLDLKPGLSRKPLHVDLVVAHRVMPLPLGIWASSQSKPGPWILLMPGLGGNSAQLSWMAEELAAGGWPVVLLDHPGSDEKAVQDALLGYSPPPGAEAVPLRLADVQAVLTAAKDGALPSLGPEPTGRQGVVLMGHSLGALTALMGSGLVPEQGVARRCMAARETLPLADLSQLLQCQLPQVTGDGTAPGASPGPVQSLHPDLAPIPLLGVAAFNGFGSLLWPTGGLAGLDVPVLLVGGSVDLVTPPVQEQLNLFVHVSHPRSRLVVVDGGSHFSLVRLDNQGQALFRLGQELVGRDPRKVQNLILSLTTEFLQGFDYPHLLSPQRLLQEGVSAFVLDRTMARRWKASLKGSPL